MHIVCLCSALEDKTLAMVLHFYTAKLLETSWIILRGVYICIYKYVFECTNVEQSMICG